VTPKFIFAHLNRADIETTADNLTALI